MNPKYYRTAGPEAHICPWCAEPSPKTGNRCGHLHKVTAKGVYFWYWGIRPTMTTTKIGRTAADMTEDTTMQLRIRAQPGYRRGNRMRVMRVAGRNAYRLFVDINGQWMDGSLVDLY